MIRMLGEKLFFETIKELRDGYFVEYSPPAPGVPMAILSLIFLQEKRPAEVAELMKAEALNWLQRYPVSLMVSAFDDSGSVISFESLGTESHLVAWSDAQTGNTITSWTLSDLSASLKTTSLALDLRQVYADIPFRTEQDVQATADLNIARTRKQNLFLKVVFTIWLAMIPAVWAITEFLGPVWLSAVVLAYTLWKILQAWRKLIGHRKPSKSEQAQAKEDLKMAHYYYHCERNPIGFIRLRNENFEENERKRIQSEAAQLNGK